jgi:hypothetical protein
MPRFSAVYIKRRNFSLSRLARIVEYSIWKLLFSAIESNFLAWPFVVVVVVVGFF